MIEVEMSKDIRKYETKALGPLSIRQVICIIIAAAYSVPIGLLLPLSWDNKLIVIGALAIPGIICGKKNLINGMSFEIFVLKLLYKNVLTPRRRRVKFKNVYKEELRKEEKKERNAKYNALSKKEKKKYEKEHTVTYSNEHKVYL